ncbi:MAG TPA: protein kinase, partial [Thermoanaerobaculia bacterium]|nr:protein kinase [Thermoanaerobaculia bacterium]
MYARAGQYEQAARVALELRDTAAALGYYRQGGNHLRLGELLLEEGDLRQAIPAFERARAFDKAGEASAELKQWEPAGRYFEKAGLLMRAASCFEKAGAPAQALRVLEREARSLEHRFRGSGDEAIREQRKQLDLHRSGLLARLERWDEAVDLLLLWGSKARAAELLERAGRFDAAARTWLDAGQPERGVRLLDKTRFLEPEVKARIHRASGNHLAAGELFAKAGHAADAAECFQAAGDWERSAGFWEAAGELSRAAEQYYRLEQWRHAARCFEADERPELAGQAYAQIPDHAAAAACFQRAGRPLKAARHFLQAGDRSAASKALQQIDESSPDFARATLLLVPLLIDEGILEGALLRLQGLRQDASATGALAVERHYWEGRVLEAQGKAREAASCFQKAVALRRDHRDAGERLERLQQAARDAESRPNTSDTAPLAQADVEAAAQKPGALRLGATLANRYRILDELGRGGMGRVYKAHDRELGETVAIKTLVSHGGDGSSEEERLLREVQICRRITHPNVVRVYDIGRFPGGIFVTMEYLQGATLDRVLRDEAPLPLQRVRELLAQILAGLAAAHSLKVVHRDLKPSNIVLSDGRPKILDFGIARVEGGDVNLTMTGEVLGSPKYMSPEQIQGEPLDARSDLYSVGVILFGMLTGKEPFTGKTPSIIA